MKKVNHTNVKVASLLALIISLGTATSGHAQTLLLQLQASNYNATVGIWSDTSGNGDDATALVSNGETQATLVTGATPNGSSAVDFAPSGTGASVFALNTPIASSSTGYTVFVYADPLAAISGDGAQAFLGGAVGGLEYRVYQGKQGDLAQNVGGGGSGTTNYPSGFSLFDVTASSSGGAFDLNSASDGTNGALTTTSTINLIGSNQAGTGGEQFHGDIAEIDIYSGVLTSAQIATEEAALTAKYVTAATPTPEPSTWALLLGGLGSLVILSRFRKVGQV